MTTVFLSTVPPLTLCVRGHATGSEEVCAAVSALCYTLCAWLDEHRVPHERLFESGFAHVTCPARSTCPAAAGAAATAFEVVKSGFSLLASVFPQQVRLTEAGE